MSQAVEVPPGSKPKQRWRFRLRLRTLLILLTLAAIPPAWVVWQRQHVAAQKHAVHEAQMLGASVSGEPADFALWDQFCYWVGGGEPAMLRMSFQRLGRYESWGPYGPDGKSVKLHWWNEANIRRFAPELKRIDYLQSLSFWDSPLPPGMLAEILPGSRHLLHLNLQSSPLTREDMAALSRTPNLASLVLTTTDVTDDDMRHIAALTDLEMLILEDTRITDDGLSHLADLTKLKRVDLSLTLVTEKSLPILKQWQVADELIVPADFPEEALAELQAAAPPKSIVRKSSLEFRFRPSAKALTPPSED